MSSQDFHNWCKLQLLLTTRTSEFLRNRFKQLWQTRSNKPWDDSSRQDLINIIKPKSFKSYFKSQRSDLQKGEIDNWDFTLLKNVFLDSDICGTGKQGNDWRKSLEKVAEIRNKLAHHPSKNVSDADFEVNWEKISKILVQMGESKEELDDLKGALRSSRMILLQSQNTSKANEMRLKGKEYFEGKKYTEAIEIYTNAIGLKGIPDQDLAVLYSNRSVSYLKRYSENRSNSDDLKNALKDAKECRKLSPEWAKASFRLGRAYAELDKLGKAIKAFEKALILEPKSKEIENALADAKRIKGAQDRYDHLDPTIYGATREQLSENFYARTGKPLEQRNIDDAMRFAMDQNPFLIYVWKAHEYRDGTNGVEQNYPMAAKYYQMAADKGNAEAMYNLAVILIDKKLRTNPSHDYTKAIDLLKKATEQPNYDPVFRQRRLGVAEAEHMLGILYSQGIHVRQDKFVAATWFERAVDHEYGSSANNLGLMYMNGDGLTRDLKRAEDLFLFAFSHGDHNAADNLTILYLRLENPEKALVWCKIAEEKGSFHAMSNKTIIDFMLRDLKQRMEKLKVVEWEKENNLSSDNLTMKERIDRQFKSESPKWHDLLENLKRIAVEVTTPKGPVDPTVGFKYPIEELEKYSHTSGIAKKMYEAMSHFLFSCEILMFISDKICFGNKLCQQFITELAKCYKLEHIVASFSLPMIEQASQIAYTIISNLNSLRKAKELNKEELELDQDARLCYAMLNISEPKEIVGFVSESVRKYPQNKYLLAFRGSMHSFMQEHEYALRDYNKLLEMEPNNYEFLYFKAVALRYLGSPKTVQAYEEYLSKAPIDDRKRPEAFYAIGTCKFPERTHNEKEILEEVEKYYKLGQEMEKEQLPFFLPHESNSRKMLEFTLNLKNMFANFEEKGPAPSHPYQAKANSTDSSRKELIIQHRQYIYDVRTGRSPKGGRGVPLIRKPPKEQKLPSSLSGLKSVYLNEIDFTKDHLLSRSILEVTSIDRAHRNGMAIMLVVEDKNKNVQRAALYNLDESDPDVKDLGIGSKLLIINPYIRMAVDGKPLIRVDDPSSVVFGEKCEDMCAYCGQSPTSSLCDGCRITKYCSRDCQVQDWKMFKHKLICVREEERENPSQSQGSKKKKKRKTKTKKPENAEDKISSHQTSTP